MNFFHHKDLGNHLLQLCPKVVKHPVYILYSRIVITVLITILSICLLENLHLSPTVLEICVLCDTLDTVLLFAPLFTMFLVKPTLSTYFRKLLVTAPSAEMTKRFIHTLLSFQILFICTTKFSYFVIFSTSVLERLQVKGTASYICYYHHHHHENSVNQFKTLMGKSRPSRNHVTCQTISHIPPEISATFIVAAAD